eukprot:scaffold100799_cov33-Cyclotella_meneghiniana.AAC.1
MATTSRPSTDPQCVPNDPRTEMRRENKRTLAYPLCTSNYLTMITCEARVVGMYDMVGYGSD